MGFRFAAIVLIIAASSALTTPGHGQTVLEKAERDQTIKVPTDDPDMASAMRKARTTLPEFLALARAPRSTTTKFAVKVAIRDQGHVE